MIFPQPSCPRPLFAVLVPFGWTVLGDDIDARDTAIKFTAVRLGDGRRARARAHLGYPPPTDK